MKKTCVYCIEVRADWNSRPERFLERKLEENGFYDAFYEWAAAKLEEKLKNLIVSWNRL